MNNAPLIHLIETAEKYIDDAAVNAYPRTDAGNAELFAALFAHRYRYDHIAQCWRIWDGAQWQADVTNTVNTAMVEAARRRYQATTIIDNPDERKRAALWSIQSESAQRVAAALSLAKSLPDLAMRMDHCDQDHALIAAANGYVIDLRTGKARRSEPGDAITLTTGAAYAPNAECPRWMQFLDEVFGGDRDLIAYIQRAVGYTLTGETAEQVFFLCNGGGANGKSTFLDTLTTLLGAYAGGVSFATFDAERRHETTYELAMMRGKRYVSVIESDEDRRLNEARIKAVTGQDHIVARLPYGRPFTYQPTWKIWMAMNHLPHITGTDRGIWRRIRVIPFLQTFEGREDRTLRATLQNEASGILNWAIAGARAWYEHGLGTCQTVEAHTEQYRIASDQVGRWMDDEIAVDPSASVQSTRAYESYRAWCMSQGEFALSHKRWAQRLNERGIATRRDNRAKHLVGVRLVGDGGGETSRVGCVGSVGFSETSRVRNFYKGEVTKNPTHPTHPTPHHPARASAVAGDRAERTAPPHHPPAATRGAAGERQDGGAPDARQEDGKTVSLMREDGTLSPVVARMPRSAGADGAPASNSANSANYCEDGAPDQGARQDAPDPNIANIANIAKSSADDSAQEDSGFLDHPLHYPTAVERCMAVWDDPDYALVRCHAVGGPDPLGQYVKLVRRVNGSDASGPLRAGVARDLFAQAQQAAAAARQADAAGAPQHGGWEAIWL